ncbi:MAG: lysostaphin resistance A-like protein [Candidatus Kapaibacteriota bacterium]
MRQVIIGIAIATIFWFIMFSPFTAQKVNFWAVMSIAAVVLTSYSYLSLKNQFNKLFKSSFKLIFLGILSAILLYLIFYIGKYLLILILGSAQSQISAVYSTKSQTPLWVISIVLLFIIGPAEEVFWRGFVFSKLNEIRNKPYLNLLLSTIFYTFVHIWAMNPILLLAAFVCGLFWGYIFLKFKTLVPGIISHSLWDFMVFVLLPLN